MVESAIFFLVGFLSATFLALLAAPAISRRAMRLAMARARLLAPLSETQARAERDALRAAHAVEIVRMEQKVASAEWDGAMARTDLGRETLRAHRLNTMVAELKDLVAELTAREIQLAADLKAMEAEAGAKEVALWDIGGQRDIAQRRLAEARARIVDLEDHIDRDRLEIASLSTQVAALEFELSDVRARKRWHAGADGAGLEEQLRLSEAARSQQALDAIGMMRTIADREEALEAARSARDALAEKLEDRERQAHAIETDLRAQLQALTTERATSGGALGAERDARHHLQAEIDALRVRLAETTAAAEALAKSDAALRLAIAKLGRDLVRIRHGHEEEPHGEAQIVNFARREPMA